MDYRDLCSDPVSQLFDKFLNAGTCRSILSSFQQLCDAVGLKSADHRNFYRKIRSRITCWKAQSLWAKLDKRAAHKEYKKGEACANTRVLVIGSGPCGLRSAIEVALLGAKSVVVEKRDSFSRNNVLHLWPFLITDLKNLGAKKFFGKFCAGAIDHISIRQLQCILLKVALLVGVEVHVNVSFDGLIEPTTRQGFGWKCQVTPSEHSLSEYEFDVLIGADGKRNTLTGFKRKEFRGKLAIAVTANFINRNSQEEASVEEISGVAFIFNQKFFKDLHQQMGIDLENIVYYKDDTHYFVMTAKKQSLLQKGVLKADQFETYKLLSRENVNQDALLSYAREAADFSTNHMLPSLDYAVNHYGQSDVAMFDFTSIFHAENASRVVERKGHKLLLCLVGDSLLEPFWPTGSGCARGFFGAFDAAFAIRSWASGKMTPLQVLAERESVYQLLSQTKPENLQKNYNQYTIHPSTRYPNLNMKFFQPEQMYHLYDGDQILSKDDVVDAASKWMKNDFKDCYNLLRWCQKVLNTGRYKDVLITDLTTSWNSGLALCALIHAFRPNTIDFDVLEEHEKAKNNQLAFDIAQREFSISPIMTGDDMVNCHIPDKLSMVSYLSQFYEMFSVDTVPVERPKSLLREDGSRNLKSPQHRLSLLQKLRNSSRFSHTRKKRDNEENENADAHLACQKKMREIKNGEFGINRTNKLPMDEIANKLLYNQSVDDTRNVKQDTSSSVSVSAMAEILASKFRGEYLPPTEQQAKKMKPAPTLYAAQPASEFCFFCKKRVFIMERMSAEGVFFHSGCLKCNCCGTNLQLSNYSCENTVVGDVRFYCFRHSKFEFRGAARRKRALEELKLKENLPVSVLNGKWADNSYVTPPKHARSPKKVPAPLASPLALPEDFFENAIKTPERIEFENSIEGLPEESEDEQLERNLRASMSSDTLTSTPDDDSDSDLESSEDDIELQEVVEEACSGRKSLTWEEALKVAETLSRHHSHESLLDSGGFGNKGSGIKYHLMGNEEDNTDTEVEADSEYESDDTEKEESDSQPVKNSSQTSSSRTKSHGLWRPHNLFGAKQSPTSPGSISAARANFFTTPSEPLRLDPWKLFDMGNKEKDDKANILTDKSESESKSRELLEAKSRVETDEETTTGATDNQIQTNVLDQNGNADTNHIEVNGQGTDEEVEDVFYKDDDDDDKDEVSKAMAQILVDMDNRSSSSEMEDVDSGGEEFMNVDEEGDKNKQGRNKYCSEINDSSEFQTAKEVSDSTVKAVCGSIENMEDDTLKYVGSGFSNKLDCVQQADNGVNENKEDQVFQNIDEHFITQTRGFRKGRRRKAIKKKLDAGSSFTTGIPQNSMDSSIYSLSSEYENNKHLVSTSTLSQEMENNQHLMDSSMLWEEVAYNKHFLNDDDDEDEDLPDEDMLLDYQMTLTQVLDDEDSDHSSHGNSGTPIPIDEPFRDNVLDTTLEDEQTEEYATLTDEGSLYLTPNVTLEDDHIGTELVENKSEPISKVCSPITLDSKIEVKSEECLTTTHEKIKNIGVKLRTKSESELTDPPNTVQPKFRPLPPPPAKSFSIDADKPKLESGRKLPDVCNLKSKVMNTEFQSEFMKKRLGSPASPPTYCETNNLNEKTGQSVVIKDTTKTSANNSSPSFQPRLLEKSMKKRDSSHIAPKLCEAQSTVVGENATSNVPEDIDDIPFADDSEDDVHPQAYFTPATSQKLKVYVKGTGVSTKDARKQILPVLPVKDEPQKKTPSRIDDERWVSSHSRTPSSSDHISDSDDSKILSPGATGREKSTTKYKIKQKKSKDQESTKIVEKFDDEMKSPSKKKRSLLSILKQSTGKSVNKSPEHENESHVVGDVIASAGKKKKTKMPNRSDKEKKKKSLDAKDIVDSVLTDNMKEMKIGCSFTDDGKRKMSGFAVRAFPQKDYVDEYSDSGESMMSTDTLSRRSRDHACMTEEELNKKIARRVQQAARKQQKQREQKRLWTAQEIQRDLEEVDVKQKELEERGVRVEMALRHEGPDASKEETELMQEWFNLVNQKNALVRFESEIMVKAKELQLEDRQGVLEQELREKMVLQDADKTEAELADEKNILHELVEVVEQRDSLVHMLEEDRLREQEEDRDLQSIMHSKGFNLFPVKNPIMNPVTALS